jgi:hypothetical protein
MLAALKSRHVWFLAVALTGMIVSGLLLALPSMLTADNSVTPNSMSVADFTSAYKQALISPLTRATSEVKDPEIAQFSQKLVTSYELDKTGANVNEQSRLSELLPDIVKIQKTALNMPLKEAGKQIKDPEISEFYARFIKNCGVDR